MTRFSDPAKRSPDAFSGVLSLLYKQVPEERFSKSYCPEVSGVLASGQRIVLTWLPPCNCVLVRVMLHYPGECMIHSLKVGLEETVHPERPLDASCLVFSSTHRLDMDVKLGDHITLDLERIK